MKEEETTDGTSRRVVLITFDDLGVSGHVNHRDTYLAVFDRIIKQSILGPSTIKVVKKKEMDNKEIELYMEGYQLQSERNMIKKYVPIRQWFMFVMYWLKQLVAYLLGFGIIIKSNTTSSSTTSNNVNSAGLACLMMNGSDDDIDNNNVMIRLYNFRPWINWYVMKIHYSQFVWYRRLFVLFSCYTYYNELRPMLLLKKTTTTTTTTTTKQKKESKI